LTAALNLLTIQVAGSESTSREGCGWLSKLGVLISGILLNVRRICEVIIGLIFIGCSAAVAVAAYSEWKYHVADPVTNGLARFYLMAGFAVLLVFFGVYSIGKARSLR
jgi:Na+-translocating ferredoxin:NAD+ oxidoreductase RnfD subunit